MLATDRSKRRIMIVVADSQLRRALERATTDHGYQPWVSGDPARAVEFAANYKPQLCVIDLNGAGLRAEMELATGLRDQSPNIRFVIVADEDNDAQRVGVQWSRLRLLLRPFAMLEFIAAIDDTLNQPIGPTPIG